MYFPAEDSTSDILGKQPPETVSLPTMDSERIASLEQSLSELQARDVTTQQKLDTLITHITAITSQKSTPSQQPKPDTVSDARLVPSTRGPPPALPSEFDGDRTHGMAFLRSCQTYIRLCPDNFSNDQTKIVWTLSYMKAGRAAKWAARVFRWEEENPESYRFVDWEDFRHGFKEEFCPAHTDMAAINRLESITYFQNKRSVDEYLDEFLDLISEAGYTDNKTVVVKFRRGLDPRIQDAIATMTSGRPSDEIPSHWYSAARTLDQNRATNEAFRASYRVPNSNPISVQTRQPVPGISRFPVNAHFRPSPGNPVPMDVDAARKKATATISCYRCGKLGHKAPDCNLRFDVRTCTVDELQSFLEDRLAALDVIPAEDDATVEEDKPKVQDFADSNE